MGLLDLPAPILNWIDRYLSEFLPPVARLLLWAAAGALISMELYRLLSPQRRIVRLKGALQEAHHRLDAFDGEIEEAWPHIRRLLSLALQRLLIVLPATVLASLPLLVFIIWLETNYGGVFPPPGEPVAIQVSGGLRGQWVYDGTKGSPRAKLMDPRGALVAEVPLKAAVPVVEKRRWWNAIIGNPAGYLPDDAPVDRIEFQLPRQQFLEVGPGWARGWEAIFFAALFLFASSLKTLRRIE